MEMIRKAVLELAKVDGKSKELQSLFRKGKISEEEMIAGCIDSVRKKLVEYEKQEDDKYLQAW